MDEAPGLPASFALGLGLGFMSCVFTDNAIQVFLLCLRRPRVSLVLPQVCSFRSATMSMSAMMVIMVAATQPICTNTVS